MLSQERIRSWVCGVAEDNKTILIVSLPSLKDPEDMVNFCAVKQDSISAADYYQGPLQILGLTLFLITLSFGKGLHWRSSPC